MQSQPQLPDAPVLSLTVELYYNYCHACPVVLEGIQFWYMYVHRSYGVSPMRSSPVPEHREHSNTVPNPIPMSHATWIWNMGMKPQWHVTNLYTCGTWSRSPYTLCQKITFLSLSSFLIPVKSYNCLIIIIHVCSYIQFIKCMYMYIMELIIVSL